MCIPTERAAAAAEDEEDHEAGPLEPLLQGRAWGFTQRGLVLLGCSLVIMLFKGGNLGSRGGNLGERVVNTRLVAQISDPA